MFSKALIKYHNPVINRYSPSSWKKIENLEEYADFLAKQVFHKGMLCKYGTGECSWLRGDKRMYPVTIVIIEDIVPLHKLEYTYYGKPKFLEITTMYSRQNINPFTRVDDGVSLWPLSSEEFQFASQDAELQTCLKKYKPDFVFPESISIQQGS